MATCTIIILMSMCSIRNSDYRSSENPDSNDHAFGSMCWGVPPKNKDRKGKDGDSLKSAVREISGKKTGGRNIPEI